MEADKSGKIKLTFELEINQPAMELIKENMEMMSDTIPQLIQNWREGMGSKRKEGQGHGMGMMMHHGQE
jgi:hypothetical protein